MISMKNRPVWFRVISIVALLIAVANLFTNSTLQRELTMLCLAVVMGSSGILEWRKKRRYAAIAFLGVAAFQMYVLIETIYVFATMNESGS